MGSKSFWPNTPKNTQQRLLPGRKPDNFLLAKSP
jgi:hypothetical protein